MMLETARKIGDLGIDGVKLHLLYVVKGTPLETMWKAGQYQCLAQQEYVDIVCDFSGPVARQCDCSENHRRPPS